MRVEEGEGGLGCFILTSQRQRWTGGDGANKRPKKRLLQAFSFRVAAAGIELDFCTAHGPITSTQTWRTPTDMGRNKTSSQ